MIKIILGGRTGNHLFQYAAGRYLALKYNTDLILDFAALFGSPYYHSCLSTLQSLQLEAKIETGRIRMLFAKGLAKVIPGKTCIDFLGYTYVEKKLFYEPRFELETNAHAVIGGSFQTPLYFPNMRDLLQEEINLSLLASDSESDDLLLQLSNSESVAIHVRRGDYCGDEYYAVCSPNYYAKAINQIRQQIESPQFFIFSDDPEWCRKEFEGDDVTIVQLALSKDFILNDMKLMSRSKHNIISNSSYAWWAAYLNKNPSQRVIMPERWVNSSTDSPIFEKKLPGWELCTVSP